MAKYVQIEKYFCAKAHENSSGATFILVKSFDILQSLDFKHALILFDKLDILESVDFFDIRKFLETFGIFERNKQWRF